MQKKQNPLSIILLSVVLVVAAAGAGSAGAVFKRGGDRDRGNSRSASQKPESRESDRAGSYRSSEPARPASAAAYTMKDRTIDAKPTYRKDTSDWDRSRGIGGSDWDRSRNRAPSIYDYEDRTLDRDTSKYRRVEERSASSFSVSFRTPRYRGGYYYYDDDFRGHGAFPCHYAHWVFVYAPDWCVRSVYYHYGYFPYIPHSRVIVVTRAVVAVIEVPIIIKEKNYSDVDYYLERGAGASVDAALADIRGAWTLGEPSLLLRHVRSDVRIDVLLDGDYSYSISGEDYAEMTRDAIRRTDTIEFRFDAVYSRGSDRVIAYGTHRFDAPDGDGSKVYVSYLLERRSGQWIITEVGSSARLIGH